MHQLPVILAAPVVLAGAADGLPCSLAARRVADDHPISPAGQQLGVDAQEVKPEARLREDLQADSASVMMLVMDIESEFGIEVEDDAIEKVKTVGDMVKYIEEKMN